MDSSEDAIFDEHSFSMARMFDDFPHRAFALFDQKPQPVKCNNASPLVGGAFPDHKFPTALE